MRLDGTRARATVAAATQVSSPEPIHLPSEFNQLIGKTSRIEGRLRKFNGFIGPMFYGPKTSKIEGRPWEFNSSMGPRPRKLKDALANAIAQDLNT